MAKNLPAMQETWVQSLCWEDPLEEGMTTHTSILAWRIQWQLQEAIARVVGGTIQGTFDPSCFLCSNSCSCPQRMMGTEKLYKVVRKSSVFEHVRRDPDLTSCCTR